MAGIGFELRRLSRGDTYLGLLRAYLYAGVIGSGPWILSILAILALGVMSLGIVVPAQLISQFQTSVTWLIALSLIYSGAVQVAYTRYVADRLFEHDYARVLPNLLGIFLVTNAPLAILSVPAALWLLPDTSVAYRLLMIIGLNLLCAVWVLTVLLSGLKQYKLLLFLYALGYSIAVLMGLRLGELGAGLEGLLLGFEVGQAAIVIGSLLLVWAEYPPQRLIEFDFLRRGRLRLWLLPTGLFFNAGIWVDKFLFWLWPGTSHAVIGNLRASVIYDAPIFLAYLTLIPGMAVFLLRVETDFAQAYSRYYDSVREGGALSAIRAHRRDMAVTAREGVYDIIKVQGFTTLFLISLGPSLLPFLGVPALYYPLLTIDTVGVGLQLLIMAGINILYYLDRPRLTALLMVFMFLSNLIFSYVSIQLGPFFYGYGFALSMLMTAILTLFVTNRVLDRLNYTTFMLG